MGRGPWGVADLADQCVLIVGVGREGAAMATRLLSMSSPPRIIALDGAQGPHIEDFRDTVGGAIDVVVCEPGSPLPEVCAEATVAVMSPGIPVTGDLHRSIRELSIPLTSGSALFVSDHRARVVGVTGSKGKSTTTTLIHVAVVD